MERARILAYITGTVDQKLLLRKEYLTAENRILKAQLQGRLRLSDAERNRPLAGSQGPRRGGDCHSARHDIGGHRRLVARKF
jgi:putative transposase